MQRLMGNALTAVIGKSTLLPATSVPSRYQSTTSHHRRHHKLWTDASEEGYGAHLDYDHDIPARFRLSRYRPPLHFPRAAHAGHRIELHEVAALFKALRKWGPDELSGSYVLWLTDNEGAARTVRRIKALPGQKRWRMNRMVRAVKRCLELYDITLAAQWISRKRNAKSDCLSHPPGDRC